MSAVMVPIKQEIVSAGVEVKVEEHSIEMDCQISVKQEIDSTDIQDVELKLEEYTEKELYHSTQCENNFKHHSLFKTHKISHIEKSPYQCSYCNKCFSRKYNLKIHQTIHTGEKPYQCSHCNKGFAQE